MQNNIFIKKDNEILDYGEKQFVLYAKKYFGSISYDDLKIILSKICGIPLEYVEFRHVYNYVVNIFVKLYEAGYIRDMRSIFIDMFRWEEKISPEYMVKFLLTKIQLVKVDGFNFGKLDIELIKE